MPISTGVQVSQYAPALSAEDAQPFSFIISGETGFLSVANIEPDATDLPTLTLAAVNGQNILGGLPAQSELALSETPGAKGNGSNITQVRAGDFAPGDVALLRYSILSGTGNPFIPGSSPLSQDFNPLPSGIGDHAILLPIKPAWSNTSGNVNAVNHNSPLTDYASFSIQRVSWPFNLTGVPAASEVSWRVLVGGTPFQGVAFLRSGRDIFVSPTGSDESGTGARETPFKTPTHALSIAFPGDTIYLRPGRYAPFEILVSGATGNPITITTLPGEERRARIIGDLAAHTTFDGSGVPPLASNSANRDGIRIVGQNHIVIKNLYIGWFWRNAVFVIGAGANTISGNHLITGCQMEYTGLSAVYVCGDRSDSPVPVGDAYRTRYVTVEGNDISNTNVITDYNNNTSNPQGEPGGVGEAITFANSVQHFWAINNYVHDTDQYGVDAKNRCADGVFAGNTFERVERYAIYIDAGEQDVRRILIEDNVSIGCRHGVVLAREEDGNDTGDELVLEDITIRNNLFFDTERSWMFLQKHPGKDTQDIGFYRRITVTGNRSFNSNIGGGFADLSIEEIAAFGTNLAGAPIVSDIVFTDNIQWNPDGVMQNNSDIVGDPRFTFESNLNCNSGNIQGVDPGYRNPSRRDLATS
ncbi:MAG: right-handed parallel beta-helix repeat-containing protein [Roseobacter sp.]